jgi:putative tryptophan/tyrosine transport system substrate-binding protein
MKKILCTLLGTFSLCALLLLFSNSKKTPFIGIVVPMEHKALTEIVDGFVKELGDQRYKVLNAQGDPTIQKAIISQFVQEGCELLVPIGTTTSQMTLNLAKGKKIICLAADAALIPPASDLLATALDDALSVKDSLSFLHTAFPDINKISVVYSSSEKVAKEISEIMESAQRFGIKVQKLMVHTMPELYGVSSFIAQDSQAIFILKDHLVVNGITTLMQQAEDRGIFIMTSDEGSVSSGGAFSIGIKERVIGQQGATIAKAILEGIDPKSISSQVIQGPFSLFINRASCLKQGVNFNCLIDAAKESNLFIEYVLEGE